MKRKLILWTVGLVVILFGVQTMKAEEAPVKETAEVVSVKNDTDHTIKTADQELIEPGFIQIIKTKIIDGGVAFMSIVLLCLILGLTVSIEKVIMLNLSSTNVSSLLKKLKTVMIRLGLVLLVVGVLALNIYSIMNPELIVMTTCSTMENLQSLSMIYHCPILSMQH